MQCIVPDKIIFTNLNTNKTYFRLVPESPRWLIVQGRYAKAREILQKIASMNSRKLPEDIDLAPHVKYTIMKK